MSDPNGDDQDVTYTITFDSKEINIISAALLFASLNGQIHEDARVIAAGLNHKLTQVRLGRGSVEQGQETYDAAMEQYGEEIKRVLVNELTPHLGDINHVWLTGVARAIAALPKPVKGGDGHA